MVMRFGLFLWILITSIWNLLRETLVLILYLVVGGVLIFGSLVVIQELLDVAFPKRWQDYESNTTDREHRRQD